MSGAERRPEIVRAMDVERKLFSNAFIELESDICDLTRGARLACEQVLRAIGELNVDENTDKYTEAPDVKAAELAIFAVDQMHKMARDLEARWYGLHNAACQSVTKPGDEQ